MCVKYIFKKERKLYICTISVTMGLAKLFVVSSHLSYTKWLEVIS